MPHDSFVFFVFFVCLAWHVQWIDMLLLVTTELQSVQQLMADCSPSALGTFCLAFKDKIKAAVDSNEFCVGFVLVSLVLLVSLAWNTCGCWQA